MATPSRTPVPPAGPRTSNGPGATGTGSDAGGDDRSPGNDTGRRARRPAAKRVYFYKSGDPQFGALPLVVSDRSFRTFESLLDELSRRVPLPMGVRRVTTPRGRHVVNQLDELHDGSSYVCSDHHRRQMVAPPPAPPPPHPPPTRRPGVGDNDDDDNDLDRHHRHQHGRHEHQQHREHSRQDQHHLRHQRQHRARDDLHEAPAGGGGGGGGGGGWRPVVQPPREPWRSGSHIKRLTLFRNGAVGPQRALLLSRQSAPDLEAVLTYFSEILRCPVHRLYTRNGTRVESLEGLFNGPSSLVAAGSEPFRAVAYDGPASRHKLPGLAKAARGPEPSSKPANFGLEATKKVIHPRPPSSRHSRYSFSIASDRVYGNGDSSTASLVSSDSRLAAKEQHYYHHHQDDHHHLQHGHPATKLRRTDKPSDMRKRIRVNTDGSMTVEMNVRLKLEEEETVHWVTNISREKIGAERRRGPAATVHYSTDDCARPMRDDGSVTIACCDDDDDDDVGDDEVEGRQRRYIGRYSPMEELLGVTAKRQMVDALQRAVVQERNDVYGVRRDDCADEDDTDNDGRSSCSTLKNERFSFFKVAQGQAKEQQFDALLKTPTVPAATMTAAATTAMMAVCNGVLEYCAMSQCSTHSSSWSSVSSRRRPRGGGGDRASGVGGEEEEGREAMELRGEVVGSDGNFCVDDDGGGGGDGGIDGDSGGGDDGGDGGDGSDVGWGNDGSAGSYQGSERPPSGGSDAATLTSACVTGEMDPASVGPAESEPDHSSAAGEGEGDSGDRASAEGELTLADDPRDIPSSPIPSLSVDSHIANKAACGSLSHSEQSAVASPAPSVASKSRARSRGEGGKGETPMLRPSPSPSLNSSYRSRRSHHSAASTERNGQRDLSANNSHRSFRTNSSRAVSNDDACSTMRCEEGEVENNDDDGGRSHTSRHMLTDTRMTTPAMGSDRGEARMATPRIEFNSGSGGTSKTSSLMSESVSTRRSQANQEEDGEKSRDGRRRAPSSHSSIWSKSYEEGSAANVSVSMSKAKSPGPASLRVMSRHSKSGVGSAASSRAASSVSSADGLSLVPVPPNGRESRSSQARTMGSSRRDRLRVTSRNGSSTATARSLEASGMDDGNRASSDATTSRPASLAPKSRSELNCTAGATSSRHSCDSDSVDENGHADTPLSEVLVSQLTDLPEESPEDIVRKWLTRIPSIASTIQDDFFTDLDLIPEEGGGAGAADADAGAEHEDGLGENTTPSERNGETCILSHAPSEDQDDRSAPETQAEENRDCSVLNDHGNCRHSSEKDNGIRRMTDQQLRLNKKLFRLLKQLCRNRLSRPELKKSNSMPELTDESWASRNQSAAIDIVVSLLSSLETMSNEEEASVQLVPLTDVAQRLRKMGPGSSDKHRSLTSEQLLHLRKLLTSQMQGRRKQVDDLGEKQAAPEEKDGSATVEEGGVGGWSAVCNDNGYGSNNDNNKNGDGESKEDLDGGDNDQKFVEEEVEDEEADEDERSHVVLNSEANADNNCCESNVDIDDAEGAVDEEEQCEGDEVEHEDVNEDNEEDNAAELEPRLENGVDEVVMEVNDDASQGDEKAEELETCESDQDINAVEEPGEEAAIEEIEEGGDDGEATNDSEVAAVDEASSAAAAEEEEETAVADCSSSTAGEATALDECGEDCENDVAENDEEAGGEGDDVSIKDTGSGQAVAEVAEAEADEEAEVESDAENEVEMEMNDDISRDDVKAMDGESETCDVEENTSDVEVVEKDTSAENMEEDVDGAEAKSGKECEEEERAAEEELASVDGGEDEDKHDEVDEVLREERDEYARGESVAEEAYVEENVDNEVGGEPDDMEQDADADKTLCEDEQEQDDVHVEDKLEEEEETEEQPEVEENVEDEAGGECDDLEQDADADKTLCEDEQEQDDVHVEDKLEEEEETEEPQQEELREESEQEEQLMVEELEQLGGAEPDQDEQEDGDEGAEQELQEEQELEEAETQNQDDQEEEHEEDTDIAEAEAMGTSDDACSKSESCPVDDDNDANKVSESLLNDDNADDAVEEMVAPETSLNNDKQPDTDNEGQAAVNDASSIHDELSESEVDANDASRPESARSEMPTVQEGEEEEKGDQEDGEEEEADAKSVRETSTSSLSDSERAHSEHSEDSAGNDSPAEAEDDLEDACSSAVAVGESSTPQPHDTGRCRDAGTQMSLDEDMASGRWHAALPHALGGRGGGSTVPTPPTPDIACRVCWSRNEGTEMPHGQEVAENPERALANQQLMDALSATEDSDPQWIVSENYLRRRALPQQCVAEPDTTSGETSDEGKYLRLNRPAQMDDISSSELEDTLSPEPCCNFYREPHGTDSDPFPSDACSLDSLKAAKLPLGENTTSACAKHQGSIHTVKKAAPVTVNVVDATDGRASLTNETEEADDDEGRNPPACGNYCTILTALQTDEGRLFSPYSKVFNPSDPWVVRLVRSLERQCMAQWLNVLEDAKTRWGMEGEHINEIILEVKRDAQRRIRLGILAELEKIKISVTGKVPQRVEGSVVENVASRILRKSSPGILEAQSRKLAHVIAELSEKQSHQYNDNNNNNGDEDSVTMEGASSALSMTEENVYATFQIPQILKEFDLKLILNADVMVGGEDRNLDDVFMDDNNGNPDDGTVDHDVDDKLLSQGDASAALDSESEVTTCESVAGSDVTAQDAELAGDEATEGQSELACQDNADGGIETDEVGDECVDEVAEDSQAEAEAHGDAEEVLEVVECESSLLKSELENHNDDDNDGDDDDDHDDGAREETAIEEVEAAGDNAEEDLTLEDGHHEDPDQGAQMEAIEDCEGEVQPESAEVDERDGKEEGGEGETLDKGDTEDGGVAGDTEDGEAGEGDVGSGVGQEDPEEDEVKEGEEVDPQSEDGAASEEVAGKEDGDAGQSDHMQESEAGEDDVSQAMAHKEDATSDNNDEKEEANGEQIAGDCEKEDADGSGDDSGDGGGEAGGSDQEGLDSQSCAEEQGDGGDGEVEVEENNIGGDEAGEEQVEEEADEEQGEEEADVEHVEEAAGEEQVGEEAGEEQGEVEADVEHVEEEAGGEQAEEEASEEQGEEEADVEHVEEEAGEEQAEEEAVEEQAEEEAGEEQEEEEAGEEQVEEETDVEHVEEEAGEEQAEEEAGEEQGEEEADVEHVEEEAGEEQAEEEASEEQGEEEADVEHVEEEAGEEQAEEEAGEEQAEEEAVEEQAEEETGEEQEEEGAGEEQVEEEAGEEQAEEGAGKEHAEEEADVEHVEEAAGEEQAEEEADEKQVDEEADDGIAEDNAEQEHIDGDDALEQEDKEDANEGGDDCDVAGDEGGEEEVESNREEATLGEDSQNGSAPEEEMLENCEKEGDTTGGSEAIKEDRVCEEEAEEDEGEAANIDEEEPEAEDCDDGVANDGDQDVGESKGNDDEDGEGGDVEPGEVESNVEEGNEDVDENLEESAKRSKEGQENGTDERDGPGEPDGESSPVAEEDENASQNKTDGNNESKNGSSQREEEEEDASIEGASEVADEHTSKGEEEGEDEKVEAEEEATEETSDKNSDIGSCDSSTAVKGSSNSSQGDVPANESEGREGVRRGTACVRGRARCSISSTRSIAGEEQCADDINGDDLDF